MNPAEQAQVDQTNVAVRDHLAVFGVDIDDPATLAAVVGTIRFVAVAFAHSPGVDRDGILRGLLLSVETMQEARA